MGAKKKDYFLGPEEHKKIFSLEDGKGIYVTTRAKKSNTDFTVIGTYYSKVWLGEEEAGGLFELKILENFGNRRFGNTHAATKI